MVASGDVSFAVGLCWLENGEKTDINVLVALSGRRTAAMLLSRMRLVKCHASQLGCNAMLCAMPYRRCGAVLDH
jgi:hypothetical protein